MLEVQTAWGWQPALYLFLGGLGAGAFIAAAVLFFAPVKTRTIKGKEKVLCASTWVATVCLVVGLLLLLSELTQPLRALMLWQSFSNLESWMALGAWIILIALVLFGITAVCLSTTFIPALKKINVSGGVYTFLFCAGSLAGLCLAIYTGVLLMAAEGIPFWDSWLLPCLFTVSALGTGMAALEIITAFVGRKDTASEEKGFTLLKRAVPVLLVIEAIVLFAYVLTMAGAGADDTTAEAASQSAALLVSGELAIIFWGLVVACALIIPLVAAIAKVLIKGKASGSFAIIGALFALVGGCALRFTILLAGIHADPVFDALSKLVS
ncbi:MAG: polysulfide reductase NrfD [Coriobacteriales bacterium]|jgi:formate-dependent nitrite reductase membrane component NrfD|nr:polysulfide reductase NrfD [Coriobacteriales bacterium]